MRTLWHAGSFGTLKSFWQASDTGPKHEDYCLHCQAARKCLSWLQYGLHRILTKLRVVRTDSCWPNAKAHFQASAPGARSVLHLAVDLGQQSLLPMLRSILG